MAKLTVEVDEELLRRFRIVALKQEKSISVVVREFLAWYVAEKEGK